MLIKPDLKQILPFIVLINLTNPGMYYLSGYAEYDV